MATRLSIPGLRSSLPCSRHAREADEFRFASFDVI